MRPPRQEETTTKQRTGTSRACERRPTVAIYILIGAVVALLAMVGVIWLLTNS
jgi:hypothetical protein